MLISKVSFILVRLIITQENHISITGHPKQVLIDKNIFFLTNPRKGWCLAVLNFATSVLLQFLLWIWDRTGSRKMYKDGSLWLSLIFLSNPSSLPDKILTSEILANAFGILLCLQGDILIFLTYYWVICDFLLL